MASPGLRYGRYSRSGNVYSLTTATLGREPLFADAANMAILIDTLRFVERRGFGHNLAWVVMPDHLHWLMELRSGSAAITTMQCGPTNHFTRRRCTSWAIRSVRAWRAWWGSTVRLVPLAVVNPGTESKSIHAWRGSTCRNRSARLAGA